MYYVNIMARTTQVAIDDLRAQLDEAAEGSAPSAKGSRVRVRRQGTGSWLFSVPLDRVRDMDFSFQPPRSLSIAKHRISTRSGEISFVRASLEKQRLLLLVEEATRIVKNASVQDAEAEDVLAEARRSLDALTDPVRRVATQRAVRAITRVLRNAAADAVRDAASQSTDMGVLVRALEEPEAIERLSGDDPLEPARLRGLRERERLLNVEGGTRTADEVASHLSLTRQAVNRRRQQGALLALDAGRHGYLYPAWQFTRGGTIKGLGGALGALKRFDQWTQHAFMVGENARLNGRRPIDLLRAGDVSAVVAAAEAYGEHGAT